MKCHYTYIPDIGKVFIPGCMGAAAMGIHNCTCRDIKTFADFEQKRYNQAVRTLRVDNKYLEQENARLNRVINKLTKK